MASIFLQDPIYITVQQVIDSTSKPSIAILPADDIEQLIYKAQREIDAYLVATFRPKFDESQEFLFPVNNDSVSYIPSILTEATLYVVEQLYLLWDVITTSVGLWDVLEEKTWPHTIKYDKSWLPTWLYIPDIAIKLLDNLKNIFRWQSSI